MSFYKLYYTDVPQHTTPEMAKLVPLQFPTREQTINAARKAKTGGGIIWRIEEPDGTTFDRDDVEAALRGERLRFNTGSEGHLIVDPTRPTWPTITSTGGMPHKQHEQRNTELPPKRPTR